MGFDAGDTELNIAGTAIAQFTGGSGDTSQSASLNEGPGGRVFGFNFQRSANGMSMSFSVRQTSPSIKYLTRLSRDQVVVPITLKVIRNLESYDVDEPIGIESGRCVITQQGISLGGGDAGDIGFTAMCIGWKYIFRGASPNDVTTIANPGASEI